MTLPDPARRNGPPTAALVGFWLIVIMALATGLAVAANYGASSSSVNADPPTGAAQSAPATQAAPPTASRPNATASARAGGVVLLAATPPDTPAPPAETPTPEATALPAEALLNEVPVGKQTRPLNCEFQTASDLAWYYGRPVTWEEVYQLVGHEPGGNPHKGFVGRSFDDQPGQLFPRGYGVYAEPIAAAFVQLGLQADAQYGQPATWLKAQIAEGRPVMVWTTSGMTIRPVATWTADDGVVVKGVPGEHTYLAVGYNSDGVWLIDPYDGQRHHFAWDVFTASWDLLDRMAVVVTDASGEAGPTPAP